MSVAYLEKLNPEQRQAVGAENWRRLFVPSGRRVEQGAVGPTQMQSDPFLSRAESS